ncbi:RND efflux system, outer membrane lipoprotein, NodT family [Russula earlei]|uniref:RND efflux system, outer membrane lipoprotein, NodT family n=1 Tax=Russula earlei TaxID=71964 RepID=A0ACC0TUQ8_9AGAM|nr:RND efflux system, outer membrane lipoprotein, NodT family [Russula earlei]
MGLTACAVSKDTATPKPELPAGFRNQTGTDTNSIATIQYKAFFTDAPLQKLLDSAITRNYDMQVAVKNIEAAQLAFRQTKWNNIPTASLGVTVGTNRPSDNSLNGLTASQFLGTSHIEDYAVTAAFSWEADIWGKIKNQQKQALTAYLQTKEAQKAVQTNIVASVAQGYYNLLMLDEQLSVAQKNLLLNDSTLRIIRLQYQSGQVTALAVQQALAQREVAAQLVPQLEQNITIQENALSILAGRLPGKTERSASLEAITLPASLSAGVPSIMVSRRPDVQNTELELTAANARVGIAKANIYPTLSITASGGLNSFKASNWFNIPASLFGLAAGGIAQPLLQHKQLQTQYELAKIDREKTVIRFRQSVLNAVGEVSDALVKIDKLKEQQDIAAGRVAILQQAIANANMLFQNGLANYLEVITAQANVLQSELDLVALKRSRLAAVVDLYRSLGGGWQ